MASSTVPKSPVAYVGDDYDLGEAGFIRLPDGEVVSTSRTYTFRHVGAHVCGETEVEVQPAK